MNTVTFLIVDNDVGCLTAERQTAQLHLHESEERFRLLVEQVRTMQSSWSTYKDAS